MKIFLLHTIVNFWRFMHFKPIFLVGGSTCFLIGPDLFDVCSFSSKSTQPLVDRYVHRAKIAIKMLMVQLVKVITAAGPLKAIMAQPSTDRTINDTTQCNCGMANPNQANQRGRVIPRCFNWMHVCPRKRGGVVWFMMQAVHVLVQETTRVHGTRYPTFLPWMHWSVEQPKMWNAPVGDSHSPHQCVVRMLCNGSLHGNQTWRIGMANPDFNTAATNGSKCCHECIVFDLFKARVHRIQFPWL